MTYVLGHDSHGHQITSATGCSGSITVPVDGEHDDAANIFGVFDAEYTDNGGLTTHTQHTLQPRHRQAEHFKTSVRRQHRRPRPRAEGGKTVGDINNGDWISFEPVPASATPPSFTARVSSAGAGGTLEVRAGSATGTLLGSATVPVDRRLGHLHQRDRARSPARRPATTTLYLVFTGGAGALYDVDAFTFTTGAAAPAPARSAGWPASASTCATRRPPTAPRSSSTPATAPRRRPGR